jgi:two-component system KDP operon response regulator KdpE
VAPSREWSQTPIIILSVREAENDKIAALDAGADDYLTKPFGTGELMARMRVALRRMTTTPDDPVLQVENLKMDVACRLVTVNEEQISLTPTEYEILRLLLQPGKVRPCQLLRQVWGTARGEMHPAGEHQQPAPQDRKEPPPLIYIDRRVAIG